MRIALVFVGLVVLGGTLAAGALHAGSRTSGVRTLSTATAVTALAADGSRAAVATDCGRHIYELFAWNPVARSAVSMAPRKQRECYGSSTGEGILEQGIAGGRLAWVSYAGGNEREEWLVTATIGMPRATKRLTEDRVSNTEDGVGDHVGNVYGDGSLLVFNTYSVCENGLDDNSCPEGIPPGYHIFNEKLWRIVGRSKRLLVASKDELTVLSVAAGRILVQRADGSLELRRGADGGLLRAFPSRPWYERVAVLDSAELVVLDRTSGRHWRVYDPVSGAQTRVLRAPAGAIPVDVERGLLVYTVGRVVHVLRLADGRERTFVAPRIKMRYARQFVFAQIEPSGLFYSYSVRGGGRVRLVPFNEIGLGR